METIECNKQVLVYRGTGDADDLWIGFSDDVTFNEAVRVLDALADLAEERGLWVYVVDELHTRMLLWSRSAEPTWESASGLQAVQALAGFWRIVRTAPVEKVAESDLTAPLLLGASGVPDAPPPVTDGGDECPEG